MKKFLKIALSLTLALALSVPAFAADANNNEYTVRNIDGISVASTVSDEQVSNLPQEVIDRLQGSDATLISTMTTYYDLESDASNTPASPFAMPRSDFSLNVSVFKLSDTEKEDDGRKKTDDAYEFMAIGDWIVNPLYEFTDCISISWSDDFTLYYDEGYTHSYGDDKRTDTMALNSVDPEAGFAYDVDLKLFDRENRIVIKGKVYKADSEGSANVCAAYGHVIVRPSSVDVGYSGGEKIDMSVGFAAGIEMAEADYDSFDY